MKKTAKKGCEAAVSLLRGIKNFLRRADLLLLLLCTAASLLGVVAIRSATNYLGGLHYVKVQLLAIGLGIVCYLVLTGLDLEILTGRAELLFIFNVLFISTLFLWGVQGQTGNRSWLAFSWMPFNLQPAELCKITFILITARMMRLFQRHISSLRSVLLLGAHLLLTVGLIIFASDDTGVALIYVFIFLLMAYTAGINRFWFLGGIAAVGAASPLLWKKFLREDQRLRVLALFDPSLDPDKTGVLWQTNLSLSAIRGGGITGQGFLQGRLTQAGANPQQHNDFIFATIGEEFGVVGCIVVLLLLLAIVIRCIRVGVRSGNYMNRLICTGIAAMMVFQIAVNVGTCLGLFPVVGLTLPFFSYGGSSIVASFCAAGLVSSVHSRPSPDGAAVYIRPNY